METLASYMHFQLGWLILRGVPEACTPAACTNSCWTQQSKVIRLSEQCICPTDFFRTDPMIMMMMMMMMMMMEDDDDDDDDDDE